MLEQKQEYHKQMSMLTYFILTTICILPADKVCFKQTNESKGNNLKMKQERITGLAHCNLLCLLSVTMKSQKKSLM